MLKIIYSFCLTIFSMLVVSVSSAQTHVGGGVLMSVGGVDPASIGFTGDGLTDDQLIFDDRFIHHGVPGGEETGVGFARGLAYTDGLVIGYDFSSDYTIKPAFSTALSNPSGIFSKYNPEQGFIELLEVEDGITTTRKIFAIDRFSSEEREHFLELFRNNLWRIHRLEIPQGGN
jgi:hypothetical protein